MKECNDCGEEGNLIKCDGCNEYYCNHHIGRIIKRMEIKPELYREKHLEYLCDDCFDEQLDEMLKK